MKGTLLSVAAALLAAGVGLPGLVSARTQFTTVARPSSAAVTATTAAKSAKSPKARCCNKPGCKTPSGCQPGCH
jgi:hypothetical protein